MEEEFVNQDANGGQDDLSQFDNGDPEGKARRKKIIIAVVAGLVICCCCVGFVYSGWNWWGDILYDMLVP